MTAHKDAPAKDHKPSLEDRVEAIEAHLGLKDTNTDAVTAEEQAKRDAQAAEKGADKTDPEAPAAA